VLWVEEKAKQVAETLGEPIPRPLIEVLEHIILSHHDKPEFGSPKVPATPEAIAVHMIENMDAKLTMALGSCRGENAAEGNWTEYMKAFGGKLYRPDVAPSDAPVEELPPDNGQPGKLKISNPLFETGVAAKK
jgi:3'-5' exoribonuclease